VENRKQPATRYTVRLTRDAEKELDRLPNSVVERIGKSLLALEENARPPGCKKIQGSDNKYRIRVGSYRVLYSVFDKVLLIEIVSAVHRKDAYRDL